MSDLLTASEEAIARETERYVARHKELFARYKGMYIAMYNGEVVDYHTNHTILYRRIDKQWGDTPVLITPVRETPIREFWYRGNRLVRE